MLSLQDNYNQLKSDYESYQKMAEGIIQKQNTKIMELDKKLDMMSLIVEISEYINKYLGSSEIVSMINDIMIGILGVTYSSVYLVQNRKLKLKVSNLKDTSHHYIINDFNEKNSKLAIAVFNDTQNISKDKSIQIHSSIFMPIYLKNTILGAIVVEHNRHNYLTQEHVKLLTALSNHLAICLENNRLYNTIRENSQIDGLTGLYNRSYFFSIMENKFKNSKEEIAIIMIDIDNFKKCNDTFGHQYGDYVLKTISKIIKDNLRKDDIIARYGGEEIIVYMFDMKNIDDIYRRMNYIRKLIEESRISYKSIKSNVTVSMGIGMSKSVDASLEKIIEKADLNLYKAKNLGKNRVIF
ncbi:GGDEF domain-containing protein [Clostridium sp. P21]|uniref:GGDEF domain-containing protein n=1 Tax=Clostridium muellerianum TaxID=2716538 RepID=A0A7Y0EEP0_9CLOT|nr:GGDEF domain-containing protein [Clostridium muellerianum]NMM61988.1 GGDEF domain-containing protein [Clostridium muellerianum]